MPRGSQLVCVRLMHISSAVLVLVSGNRLGPTEKALTWRRYLFSGISKHRWMGLDSVAAWWMYRMWRWSNTGVSNSRSKPPVNYPTFLLLTARGLDCSRNCSCVDNIHSPTTARNKTSPAFGQLCGPHRGELCDTSLAAPYSFPLSPLLTDTSFSLKVRVSLGGNIRVTSEQKWNIS